jgi:hypothetical protein
MKARFSPVAGLVLSVCAAGLFADTIPGGDVSGVWHKANSPFFMAGDITIPASDTLDC